MIHLIGEAAGKVWKFLERRGEAIGWLAREDKLLIEKRGRFITYALKGEGRSVQEEERGHRKPSPHPE